MSESGTMARVEGVTEGLDRVLAKLDRIDERVTDLRVGVEALRGALENVRGLVDGAHGRAEKLEARVAQLETAAAEHRGEHERAPQPPGRLSSVGLAAGSGGAVAAIAELIRALLSGGT